MRLRKAQLRLRKVQVRLPKFHLRFRQLYASIQFIKKIDNLWARIALEKKPMWLSHKNGIWKNATFVIMYVNWLSISINCLVSFGQTRGGFCKSRSSEEILLKIHKIMYSFISYSKTVPAARTCLTFPLY